MKTTSRLALIAASGILLGAAVTPAKAADLGGGCCADLEERVAELEATTARKGNRVVSLQVYGQVNKGLLIWDDGVNRDAFVVDNQVSTSRVGFQGKASIKPGWTAGYNLELELNDARTDQISNTNADGTRNKAGDEETAAANLSLRLNNFYVESDKLGRITVGQASTAADGAFEVVLANSGRHSDINLGTNFNVRVKGQTGANSVGSTLGMQGTTPATAWASNIDSSRNDVIRYDSPSIYGFILSSSWGDNDYADVALRFKKEFGSIRVAAAIAYQWDNQNAVNLGSTDNNFEAFGGSISVMHVPTGLYAAFQTAERQSKDSYTAAGVYNSQTTRADASFWYAQAGIEKKFMPYGATTIYGEYGEYDNFRAFKTAAASTDATSSTATRWGFGVNQTIDSAAMDIYAHATFWSFDDDNAAGRKYEDMSTVLVGSRIKF